MKIEIHSIIFKIKKDDFSKVIFVKVYKTERDFLIQTKDYLGLEELDFVNKSAYSLIGKAKDIFKQNKEQEK